jgi:hypothetical protein
MTSKKLKRTKSGAKKAPERVPADWLPRIPLEQALRVADALYSAYAGKATSSEDIAKALGLGARSGHFSYLISSALAYGIVNREKANVYSLSEIGRKIIAPTYDQEAAEGIRKAVLNPFLPTIFYSDYDGHPIPPNELLPSILESRYGVPGNRAAAATGVIVDNGVLAGIIQRAPLSGQYIVNLTGKGPRENLL